jgi:hypothetical protein
MRAHNIIDTATTYYIANIAALVAMVVVCVYIEKKI